MPLPLRTAAAWQVIRLVERRPVLQQPAHRVRAASDRRRRLLAAPGMTVLTGRPDPRTGITERTFPLPDSTPVGLRVYRPHAVATSPRPVVVNFHGGGWVSGDARQSEWWCAGLAAAADVVVVSVDYRLAPEHPFPIPVEDCYAATAWVAGHAAELDVDAGRLAVMGDSAGGNLAAVVAVLARDRGGPRIGLQILIYPVVELDADYPSHAENAHAPVLTRKDVDHLWTLYLSGPQNDPKHPHASPLFAEHHDLPPALVQTAQHDPLRDHGPAYAAALRAAGGTVRLTNYPDAVHGFVSLPGMTTGGRPAMTEAAAELRRVLG